MQEKNDNNGLPKKAIRVDIKQYKPPEGYPLYPADEDIYSRSKQENDIDPEMTDQLKSPNEIEETFQELNFDEQTSGSSLDVPGSELDNEQENIGSEDEENNYYSIGGDAHDDLEEDQS